LTTGVPINPVAPVTNTRMSRPPGFLGDKSGLAVYSGKVVTSS
jgi:hypothetical protein